MENPVAEGGAQTERGDKATTAGKRRKSGVGRQAAKASQEGGRQKTRAKAEVRCDQQSARTGAGDRQDISRKGCASVQSRREEKRRQGPRVKGRTSASAAFRAGPPS